jgi:hypothetical protein
LAENAAKDLKEVLCQYGLEKDQQALWSVGAKVSWPPGVGPTSEAQDTAEMGVPAGGAAWQAPFCVLYSSKLSNSV